MRSDWGAGERLSRPWTVMRAPLMSQASIFDRIQTHLPVLKKNTHTRTTHSHTMAFVEQKMPESTASSLQGLIWVCVSMWCGSSLSALSGRNHSPKKIRLIDRFGNRASEFETSAVVSVVTWLIISGDFFWQNVLNLGWCTSVRKDKTSRELIWPQ